MRDGEVRDFIFLREKYMMYAFSVKKRILWYGRYIYDVDSIIEETVDRR